MAAWTSEELNKIEAAEELELSALRRDGTLRHAVTMWVVRLGDDLYVRAVNGREGAWFRATQVRHEGRIEAGSVHKQVTFVDADPQLNNQIDALYRTKYRQYSAPIVNSVLTPQAVASTLKLVPK
jgi:hypothetical protein